jgi:5'-3' exonuclease
MPRRSPRTKVPKRVPVILPAKRHEPGEKVVVLVDGMNLAYRAYWAYSKLKYKTLDKTLDIGLYYGALDLIRTWLMRNGWRLDKLIIFWDGRRDPKRMKIYPGYKSKRDGKRDSRKHGKFMRKVKKLRSFFNSMGIAQALDPRVEGDDMCYLLIKEYIAFNRIVIISGDRDFDQLVNHDVSVYDPGKDRITVPGLVGAHNYGLNINQLVDFKCLAGDHSDTIPGYGGIAEVRGAAFLEKFGSIQKYLADKKAEFPGLADKEKLAKVYKKNRLLMDIKYFMEKFYSNRKVRYYRDQKYPEFNEQKYLDYCSKWGLKTFRTDKYINQLKAWHG